MLKKTSIIGSSWSSAKFFILLNYTDNANGDALLIAEKAWYFLFNRGLNRGCLVYMFSLGFSGSKFLINWRRQIRVRNFFYATFCGRCDLFILCLKLLFRNCVTFILGGSLIKFCSLKGCKQALLFYSLWSR